MLKIISFTDLNTRLGDQADCRINNEPQEEEY
jgi:hypothetical protein